MKLGQFTQEELNSVLRKNKNKKQPGSMKYPQKYGRPGNLTTSQFILSILFLQDGLWIVHIPFFF